MIRDIITIDEAKCTGCGLCIPNCPEGALQIVDGVAKLVSDQMCDGLGACLGECPEDAIVVEQREADSYNEEEVVKHIMTQGNEVLEAHLDHLREHGEEEYIKIAEEVIQKERQDVEQPLQEGESNSASVGSTPSGEFASALYSGEQQPQWPIQLQLAMPTDPVFHGSDVVLAADCTAYAVGDFHERYLQHRAFTIACPKLDSNLEVYRDKIKTMIDESRIASLTIVIMQVPCCRGLLAIATQALEQAARSIPVRTIVIDIKGEVLAEERIA